MNDLLNHLLNVIKILAVTIGFIVSSLLHGTLPTSNSLQALWQVTPPLQTTTQSNQQGSSSTSNSNLQQPNHNSIKNRQVEHIAKKLRTLPTTQIAASHKAATNVYIKAGDSAVPTARLTKASQIIEDISLPTLNAVVGLSPAKNIEVVLFSSPKTYANALVQANIDPNSIQSIVANTGGLTVNTTIWIPLYNLADNSDLANVLSHELFHACASSQGYGDQLPTWLNEGTAWRIGLTAMQKVNPRKASLEMTYFESDVRNAAKNGLILPLTASESDILNAQYNVEYEDFMAVEQLVKQYGISSYKTFIQNLKTESVSTNFQNSFNTTIDKFQNNFIKTNFHISYSSAGG
ncbi:hypothetical protein [Desulfosporosinus sp. Sb-LF]|uniref:hypothetical protein n=1 Tax=Desulfosporosinus sp. Sb-LF TaxID=2560027 RepID=UPI00107F368F|nr:hypothetical protein [Desulfosporosinus sp. Sb-LF]TGE31763.1 hypothetical protein E4K68_15280 [Desulfosporosinus sp. Sb-LF]